MKMIWNMSEQRMLTPIGKQPEIRKNRIMTVIVIMKRISGGLIHIVTLAAIMMIITMAGIGPLDLHLVLPSGVGI
jgi:hypothetical protein